MNQIFLFVASLGNVALLITIWLGWRIEDASSLSEVARQGVSFHFLFALATSSFVLFVHALVLTYFMGTGRWIQETSEAYQFDGDARNHNMKLKYKVLPGMMLCLCLILITGAFGAIADPASNTQMEYGATIHFTLALSLLLANLLVNVIQYFAITENSGVVDAVYQEVLKVRKERGLSDSQVS
ncbi:hypothetical protein [Thalassoglobus polymorphus]|uniref:Uncharacterized protein n=1 Tax=Thalassoglobus polymorphus TaxID=2527994 RepID=A0A517QS74_9PLAN|nr:hypothetical protein [Thalassoglobus polymorphus]QDT34479.1 hypothetical protein Mal48_37400 [Thalassoglobus polymorphus]